MKLYTTKETAQILGISYSLLTRLRNAGLGPKFIQLTPKGSVRYTEEAIKEYATGGHDENTSNTHPSDEHK